MRLGGAAVLAAGITIMLAGCGSSAPKSDYTATVTVAPSTAASSSASATPTQLMTPPATQVGTATPIASADSAAPAGQCASSVLKLSLTAPDAGAGNIDQYIVFTNTGSVSCTLEGTPGVSVVGDGNGTQLGQPARRDQSDVTTVTLAANGGTARALLHSVNVAGGGGPLGSACKERSGDGLRVYPPHFTTAYFIRVSGIGACTSSTVWMNVGPVKAG